MHSPRPVFDEVETDIWNWMRDFVSVKNDFYGGKFPPCPFALRALMDKTVDVAAWRVGDTRAFIRSQAESIRTLPKLTTRVIVFPPRAQFAWGISEFVESLNARLIPDNLFLNTGIAKTTVSRYDGSLGKPYFIVVVNRLDAVLKGADALKRTGYYEGWPESHYEIVVGRRERMAQRHGGAGETPHI
jgi:hypothetical protein